MEMERWILAKLALRWRSAATRLNVKAWGIAPGIATYRI